PDDAHGWRHAGSVWSAALMGESHEVGGEGRRGRLGRRPGAVLGTPPGFALGASALLLLVALSSIVVLSGIARAAGATARPLRIANSSLTQDGELLVWRVQLEQAFSPRELARNHRTLCLLTERPASGSV